MHKTCILPLACTDLYMCRSTLVCDSTAEGKQLSWGQNGERHKVATVDGTLFAKAGSITGGTSADMTSRAQRWDDKAYETLKQVCRVSRVHAMTGMIWPGEPGTDSSDLHMMAGMTRCVSLTSFTSKGTQLDHGKPQSSIDSQWALVSVM